MTTNMRNYSRVKRHASGIKWGKPVFAPEYKEAQDNSRIALVAMVLMSSGIISGIVYLLNH